MNNRTELETLLRGENEVLMRESKWDKVNGRGVKLESGDGSDSGKRQKEQGGSEQLFDWTDNQTPRLKREGGGAVLYWEEMWRGRMKSLGKSKAGEDWRKIQKWSKMWLKYGFSCSDWCIPAGAAEAKLSILELREDTPIGLSRPAPQPPPYTPQTRLCAHKLSHPSFV